MEKGQESARGMALQLITGLLEVAIPLSSKIIWTGLSQAAWRKSPMVRPGGTARVKPYAGNVK